MTALKAREPVVLAENFSTLVAWHVECLGFVEIQRHEDGYHYAKLEHPSGMQVGIADAKEMGVEPNDRSQNTVVLQIEVPDVPALFEHLAKGPSTLEKRASVRFGPSFDANGKFWFGAFVDPEGNPWWVVDVNCP